MALQLNRPNRLATMPGPLATAALLVLLLAGCVSPHGAPIQECGPEWEPAIVDGPPGTTGFPFTVSIECYTVIAERRLQVGFFMPPGPECYAVGVVEVIEDGEAISLEVRVAESRSPLAGACPPEELAWSATVELNRPVEGRRVLDASVPSD
jgi:hypothetical protein